jgi:hypothetical protein
MVLNTKRVEESLINKVLMKFLKFKIVEAPLVLGSDTVIIKKAEGADLDKFWKDHGYHFRGIIDNLSNFIKFYK